MATQPTRERLAFRATLLRKYLATHRAYSAHGTPGLTDLEVDDAGRGPVDGWYLRITAGSLPGLATALALPDPADVRDCSEQISTLKGGGGGYSYASDHRDWAMPILARLAAQYGDYLERAPKIITVAELRAVATGAGNG